MSQPRPCQFCLSRHLACQPVPAGDFQPAGHWQVECLFCHGKGPMGLSSDEAWQAWNGAKLRAPASFGVVDGILI